MPGDPREPGRASRPTNRHLLVALGVLVALAAASLVGYGLTTSSTTAATGARVVDWPTAGSASPTTPAGDRAWPGTAPPPANAASTGSRLIAPDAASSPHPGSADGGDFCDAARTGLVSLGGEGLSVLRTLATGAGDVAPEARTFVQSAVTVSARLQQTAPPAVADATNGLASAWSGLAGALERAGYDRTSVVTLAIRYLASPAVNASWDLLTHWSGQHCGVDLLGGRATGG